MTTTNARIFARTQRLTAACTVPLALLALIAVACSNEPRSSNQDVSGFRLKLRGWYYSRFGLG